jgi:hypothetical protein
LGYISEFEARKGREREKDLEERYWDLGERWLDERLTLALRGRKND